MADTVGKKEQKIALLEQGGESPEVSARKQLLAEIEAGKTHEMSKDKLLVLVSARQQATLEKNYIIIQKDETRRKVFFDLLRIIFSDNTISSTKKMAQMVLAASIFCTLTPDTKMYGAEASSVRILASNTRIDEYFTKEFRKNPKSDFKVIIVGYDATLKR